MKEAVRELLKSKQEVFMPLVHWAGEAQVDFGYALTKISGVRRGRKGEDPSVSSPHTLF